MPDLLILFVISLLILIVVLLLKKDKTSDLDKVLSEQHRKILLDFNDSLNKVTDRFNKLVSEEFKYNVMFLRV